LFHFDIENEAKIEASFRLRFDIVDITTPGKRAGIARVATNSSLWPSSKANPTSGDAPHLQKAEQAERENKR
jgi:hypothetical protein